MKLQCEHKNDLWEEVLDKKLLTLENTTVCLILHLTQELTSFQT